VQVAGANFYPASVVAVNGISQSTTYSSGEQLQATLSSSVASTIGEVSVSVTNPAPGGGTSISLPLTLYEVINVDASFLASVPGSPMLYASVPSSSATNPNTVIPINPTTGALGTPIPVGNNPGLLAASSDGSYLFVVANQDQTVQRINLSTQAVDQTFPFPPNNTNCCGALSAVDLKGVSGSPQEVVLALDISGYGFAVMALYNDTGLVNYVPATSTATVDFSSFAYAGGSSTIYALPFSNAQNSFFNILTITAQGLQFTPNEGGNYTVNNTTGAEVVSDGTLLYTSAGEVWNPTTQVQVGSFPVTTYNDTTYPNLYNLVVDTASSHIFVIGQEPYGGDSSSMIISAYGQNSLSLTGALAFPQESWPYAENLTRWGSNGFAFLTQATTVGSQVVYLLTSSLAGPVTSNPVPQLASLAPSSTPQNSSALQLTLNGQGFTEASVVMWNGTALQTTYVTNSVLTALVPATDFATSGTASVTINNPAPGGGTSSASVFAISALVPVVSFSSSAINFANEQVGQSSNAQTIGIQNPGTASLIISGVSITGAGAPSFQQTNSCGNTLAPGANCALSVVFTPAASGPQTAVVAFTDNAAGSPQTLSISGIGSDLGLATAPEGSTSATVAAGGTASYNLVVGGSGFGGNATITCTGAPAGAICSVPSSINLSATSATTLTVTVTTTARTSAALPPRHLPWFWAAAMFGLFGLPGVQRKKKRTKWIKGVMVLSLAFICSCGGGTNMQTSTPANANGTPAGQYTLTLTASAGSSSQSLSLNLTVQ
jgi:Abnormal spindle-like microcephaly-assoc'd, ASPM-SPD-2-Hydin